nr:MAG TPA: hypothetical protein [Caudoviricetes sp.]
MFGFLHIYSIILIYFLKDNRNHFHSLLSPCKEVIFPCLKAIV